MNPDDQNQGGQGADQGAGTAPSESSPAAVPPVQNCATCGGTSANGNCTNCAQPNAACTCPPVGGGMGGGGPTEKPDGPSAPVA